MNFDELAISFIRSQLIPGLVTFVVMFMLNNFGIEIDTTALATVMFPVISGAYYALARYLEGRFAWAGRLLGINSQPNYTAEEVS